MATLEVGIDTWKYFKGRGVAIVFHRGPQFGSSNNGNDPFAGTAHVRVTVEAVSVSGTPSVVSGLTTIEDLNLYYDKEWFYKDGADPRTGENPCVVRISSNLPGGFRWYRINILNLSGSNSVFVDGIWVFNEDPLSTDITYQTNVDISSLSAQVDLDFQRNDITVVGQRKGVWVAGREEDLTNFDVQSAANLVYTNYYSRALDLNSIFNPSSDNHIGFKSTFYIQEPAIVNTDRASWLSRNILGALRSQRSKPKVKLIGEPKNTLGDCVQLVDSKGSSAKFWIKGITETFSDKEWSVDLDVDSVPPFPSYQDFDPFDISNFSGSAVANFEITDTDGFVRRGDNTVTTASEAHNSTVINVSSASAFPATGVIIIIDNSNPSIYGKFVYTSKTSTSFSGTMVYVSKSSHTFGSGSSVTNAYNPYESDDTGTYMMVSFDTLVPSRVSVGVKKDNTLPITEQWVAGLSNGGGIEDGLPRTFKAAAGEHFELIWGGIDQTGITHPEQIDDENNPLYERKDFYAHDGDYVFQVDIEDLETGGYYRYNSKNLGDVIASTPTQIVGILRSGVDTVAISHSYPNSRTDRPFRPTDGSISLSNIGSVSHYADGSYHLVARSDAISYQMRNYLIFENEGGININIAPTNNDSREYRVRARVETYTYEYGQHTTVVNGGTTYLRYTGEGVFGSGPVYQSSSNFPVNPEEYIDVFGGFVRFSGARSIPFDPEANKWGGDTFVAFIRDWDSDDEKAAYAHCVRIVFDIVDKSGRVVISTAGDNDYRKAFYQENDFTVGEFWMLPTPGALGYLNLTGTPSITDDVFYYAPQVTTSESNVTRPPFESIGYTVVNDPGGISSDPLLLRLVPFPTFLITRS